ncbi:hypothetical protein H7097_02190 [Aeromicrobium sp.]|nr:hypothetical protein [Candidatus Saccharibacteria bacterium]
MSSIELTQDTLRIAAEIDFSERTYADLGNRILSVYEHKDELIEAIQSNRVTVVIAPTGTGKSTQMPQIAKMAGFDVVNHTQPRRRAAINVAERVSSEIGDVLGQDVADEMVACHTGAGLIGDYDASISVMTEGVHRIRELFGTSRGGKYYESDATKDMSEKELDSLRRLGCEVVPGSKLLILDEVHENSNEMWMVSGLAKTALRNDPNLHIVVMTATADKFNTIDYWTTDDDLEPAVIELNGGTNYEIEHREEPDSTTAREAVKAAIEIFNNPDAHDGSNTIQIFEAGKREIKDTINKILRDLPPEVREKALVVPNHAKLTPQESQPAYDDYDGIKIVVQTNIGKTSLTIPRTRYVISSGQERQMLFEETDWVLGLELVDSSIDDIIQEKGRCGRTATGIFILTTHEGQDFVPMEERPEHCLPEILRSNVDAVILGLAMAGEDIRGFDGNPKLPKETIDRAMHRLQVLGAFDDQEQLTNLGRAMGKYPASPEHQRALVECERFNVQTRLAMAAIIASAEVGGLRLFEKGSASWEVYTPETASDLFAHLETFIKIKQKKYNKEAKEDLDVNNIIRADELYRKIARRSGVDNIPELQIPGPIERRNIRESIVKGYVNSAYLPVGDGMFKSIAGLTIPREISNRSVVSKNTNNAVLGKAIDIQLKKGGETYRKPIIELVTEVPILELAKFAGNLTSWRSTGYQLRGGKFVEVQEQLIGQRFVSKREIQANTSPQLRAAVIEQVKVQPGEHLKSLYKIKSVLEGLARRSRVPIPQLTQDKIDELIARAAPDEVKSPGHIEDNLRQIISDEAITIDAFLNPEAREKIRRDAPDVLVVEGYPLKLQYIGGKPIVRKPSEDMILGLTENPTLVDGRSILFMYEDKKYSWQLVRQRIIGISVI